MKTLFLLIALILTGCGMGDFYIAKQRLVNKVDTNVTDDSWEVKGMLVTSAVEVPLMMKVNDKNGEVRRVGDTFTIEDYSDTNSKKQAFARLVSFTHPPDNQYDYTFEVISYNGFTDDADIKASADAGNLYIFNISGLARGFNSSKLFRYKDNLYTLGDAVIPFHANRFHKKDDIVMTYSIEHDTLTAYKKLQEDHLLSGAFPYYLHTKQNCPDTTATLLKYVDGNEKYITALPVADEYQALGGVTKKYLTTGDGTECGSSANWSQDSFHMFVVLFIGNKYYFYTGGNQNFVQKPFSDTDYWERLTSHLGVAMPTNPDKIYDEYSNSYMDVKENDYTTMGVSCSFDFVALRKIHVGGFKVEILDNTDTVVETHTIEVNLNDSKTFNEVLNCTDCDLQDCASGTAVNWEYNLNQKYDNTHKVKFTFLSDGYVGAVFIGENKPMPCVSADSLPKFIGYVSDTENSITQTLTTAPTEQSRRETPISITFESVETCLQWFNYFMSHNKSLTYFNASSAEGLSLLSHSGFIRNMQVKNRGYSLTVTLKEYNNA